MALPLSAFSIPGALFVTVIILLAIWEGIWKGIALWHSARGDQLPWFVCILIFNTAGILPIIYLAFFRKKRSAKP